MQVKVGGSLIHGAYCWIQHNLRVEHNRWRVMYVKSCMCTGKWHMVCAEMIFFAFELMLRVDKAPDAND